MDKPRRLGNASWINSLVFSPDGETLIISNADRIVKLLHIPSGRVRGELHGTRVQFLLPSGADGRLCQWRRRPNDQNLGYADRECLKTLEGHQAGVCACLPSPHPDESYRLASVGPLLSGYGMQSGHLAYL